MKSMMKEMIEMKQMNQELKNNMGHGRYENIFLCFQGHEMVDRTNYFAEQPQLDKKCL